MWRWPWVSRARLQDAVRRAEAAEARLEVAERQRDAERLEARRELLGGFEQLSAVRAEMLDRLERERERNIRHEDELTNRLLTKVVRTFAVNERALPPAHSPDAQPDPEPEEQYTEAERAMRAYYHEQARANGRPESEGEEFFRMWRRGETPTLRGESAEAGDPYGT